MTNTEKPIIPESEDTSEKEKILKSSVTFAKEVTVLYPQFKEDTVQYYFAGSLAINLLAQAEELRELQISDSAANDEMDKPPLLLSPDARKILIDSVRKIGDFDFVRVRDYKGIGKGGVISVDQLSDQAFGVFKQSKVKLDSIMCDPLPHGNSAIVLKIRVDKDEFLVPHPETMMLYKVINILQSFGNAKDEQLVKDFCSSYLLARSFKDQSHLIELVHNEIFRSQGYLISETVPIHVEKYGEELADFVQEVMQLHPDYELFKTLETDESKTIQMLIILQRFDGDLKKRVGQFIKENKETFDDWHYLGNPRNNTLASNYFTYHPDVFVQLTDGSYLSDVDTTDPSSILKYVTTNPWIISRLASNNEEIRGKFDKKPMITDLEKILSMCPVTLVDQCIEVMKKLLHKNIELYQIYSLMTNSRETVEQMKEFIEKSSVYLESENVNDDRFLRALKIEILERDKPEINSNTENSTFKFTL